MKTVKLAIVVLFVLQELARCWIINDVNLTGFRESSFDMHNETEDDMTSEEFEERLKLIFPGTKWCGAGNEADNYEDLGSSNESDACCREHDFCPDVILAGYTRYNLTNTAYYTRLHCNCDEKFRLCLRKVNSKTSSTIGKMYFNMLGTKCFKLYYPIVGCKRWGGWLNKKCLEYDYDYKKKQKYQWFDVPKY